MALEQDRPLINGGLMGYAKRKKILIESLCKLTRSIPVIIFWFLAQLIPKMLPFLGNVSLLEDPYPGAFSPAPENDATPLHEAIPPL